MTGGGTELGSPEKIGDERTHENVVSVGNYVQRRVKPQRDATSHHLTTIKRVHVSLAFPLPSSFSVRGTVCRCWLCIASKTVKWFICKLSNYI